MAMTKDYILTIDAGTTSIRAVVFNHQGHIVTREVRKFEQLSPRPGWLEQDPIIIFDTVQSVLADALINGHIQPDQIDSIAIANQRETAVIWDKATGLPVHNAISWRSNQTQPLIDQLKQKVDRRIIQEKTGLRLDPIFSASKIRFILDHIPDGQQRAEKGDLLFGNINTWLAWQLSDGTIFKTDITNASRTLLFNINTQDWDPELLALFNIPREILPEVVTNDQILGETSTHQLYGRQVPIAAMIGSQQAALFGQTDFDMGSVKASFGSGGFIVMNTGTTPKFSVNNLLTSIGYTFTNKTNYVLEGGILTAGDAIDWFVDQLQFLDDFQTANTAAQQATSQNEIYFVPAFNGLAAPYWDNEVRGTFLGLTRGTTREDLVKAALQAIAYQTEDILSTLTQDTNLPITKLRVDGGASRDDYLLQFLADITQVPVQRSESRETTALGAAFIAGLNTGYFKDLAELRHLNAGGQTFEPAISSLTRSQLYSGWRQAVKAAQLF
ncbi:glycerol kinase GlpK [Agrilactobacillus fermenti]|uniref:glycerol kinase GlpK n=1 Tax=Agrilactobacillus fermenti TaxID=2586909 RepID=UPI001E32DBAF|nr:glycerol kinase GlpK [Agrilactobacillus fermenti]MCD2256143.1 glycerol kinase GlpK [Agrilactobacillus fermenti]